MYQLYTLLAYNRLLCKLLEIIIAKQILDTEYWLGLRNKINFVPENYSMPLSKHCKSILQHLRMYECVNLISDARNS